MRGGIRGQINCCVALGIHGANNFSILLPLMLVSIGEHPLPLRCHCKLCRFYPVDLLPFSWQVPGLIMSPKLPLGQLPDLLHKLSEWDAPLPPRDFLPVQGQWPRPRIAAPAPVEGA